MMFTIECPDWDSKKYLKSDRDPKYLSWYVEDMLHRTRTNGLGGPSIEQLELAIRMLVSMLTILKEKENETRSQV